MSADTPQNAPELLGHFIYGKNLDQALATSSVNARMHTLQGFRESFEESSVVDVIDVTGDGCVVKARLRDSEVRGWLAEPTKSQGVSARMLFIDDVPDSPDKLPVNEGLLRDIVRSFRITSCFLDLLSRQHMPGRQIHRKPASGLRHEIWWSAVLRSQMKSGVVSPVVGPKIGAVESSRNVAFWQRFAIWSDYNAQPSGSEDAVNSTATYLVIRCPLHLKRSFFEAASSSAGKVILGHPLGIHAYFMEHIVRETYDVVASFSVPLYQWENYSEMRTPEGYTRRSRAFLTLARQIHQITTDNVILSAAAKQLMAECKWFSDQLDSTHPRDPHACLPDALSELQSTVEDMCATLVQEVELISTYMRLCLERSKIGVSECYAMINQRDAEVNIQMAAESAAMARASREDNRSLNVIQIMSMIFLPGSLVSSIFGMGFFTTQTPDGGGAALFVASGSWWLYFAVAVPLTVAVVLVMRLWPKIQRRRDESESLRRDSMSSDAETGGYAGDVIRKEWGDQVFGVL